MVILLIALVFVMPPISVFQGAAFCRFSSSRALPGNVQSAVAVFELNLGTVEVRRFGEDSLVGERIPRMLILTAYKVVGWKSGGVLFPIIPMFDNSRFPVNISGSMFDFTRTQT